MNLHEINDIMYHHELRHELYFKEKMDNILAEQGKIMNDKNVGDHVLMVLFEEASDGYKGYIPIFGLIEEQLLALENSMTDKSLAEALVYKESNGFHEKWPLESWRSG